MNAAGAPVTAAELSGAIGDVASDGGPHTLAEIRVALHDRFGDHLTESRISRQLGQLVSDGILTRPKRGHYQSVVPDQSAVTVIVPSQRVPDAVGLVAEPEPKWPAERVPDAGVLGALGAELRAPAVTSARRPNYSKQLASVVSAPTPVAVASPNTAAAAGLVHDKPKIRAGLMSDAELGVDRTGPRQPASTGEPIQPPHYSRSPTAVALVAPTIPDQAVPPTRSAASRREAVSPTRSAAPPRQAAPPTQRVIPGPLVIPAPTATPRPAPVTSARQMSARDEHPAKELPAKSPRTAFGAKSLSASPRPAKPLPTDLSPTEPSAHTSARRTIRLPPLPQVSRANSREQVHIPSSVKMTAPSTYLVPIAWFVGTGLALLFLGSVPGIVVAIVAALVAGTYLKLTAPNRRSAIKRALVIDAAASTVDAFPPNAATRSSAATPG